jgi:hypothetical protein
MRKEWFVYQDYPKSYKQVRWVKYQVMQLSLRCVLSEYQMSVATNTINDARLQQRKNT